MTISTRYCGLLAGWFVAVCTAGLGPGAQLSSAAEAKPAVPKRAVPKRATTKPAIPKPENLPLTTRDGVLLHCTYYPGGYVQKTPKEAVRIPGKEVVPIIMLHGWEGRRRERDLDRTASWLQRTAGHAVVVPDLRGHGDSVLQRVPGGREEKISLSRMRSRDLYAMQADVEAVKKFLLDKNNAGELNIEMLCVIGADMGAIVATNWAAYDWSRPQLPSFKQGRDVKALVLLSPRKSFKAMTLNAAIKHQIIRSTMPVMIVAGSGDRKQHSEAKSIYAQLERSRKPQPREVEDRTLFFVEPDTTLSGTKLLTPSGLKVYQLIGRFIDWRLVSNKDELTWKERKNPFDTE
jgi:hypothetical protein